MLQSRFEWTGPVGKDRSKFDYLPLVLQADPKAPPELFELPPSCTPPVHIHHPKFPFLDSLDLQWYPIPAVCALDLSVRIMWFYCFIALLFGAVRNVYCRCASR